jgi:lipid II:glycine glycyltransferase (peptidoglycan interpeptide bridge formation enzyme)
LPNQEQAQCRGVFRFKLEFKINIEEIVGKGVDWIDLDKNRDEFAAVVNTVMNLRLR